MSSGGERLSAGQRAIKTLTDRALAQPRNPRLTWVDIPIVADPQAIERELRAGPFGDLMLRDGDTLSAEGSGDYYPELNLFIGQARVAQVALRVYGWEYPKYRIDPNGPTSPPYDVIEYPGEKDWARSIEIQLWYTNGTESACQKLSLYASSMDAGAAPTVSRDVVAPSYAETGYEGHNQAGRDCSGSEALALVRLATRLMASRAPQRRAPGVE